MIHLFPILSLLLGLLWSVKPNICACCADRGYWATSMRDYSAHYPFQDLYLEELSKLQLSGALTSGEGEKDTEILDWQFYSSYKIQGSFNEDGWVFFIINSKTGGRVAKLEMATEDRFEEFKSDIGRGSSAVQLFKEWRWLNGAITSDKDEIPVVAQNPKLIIQGFGNHCVNAGDFEHWILHFSVGRPAQTENGVEIPALEERVYAYGAVQLRP